MVFIILQSNERNSLQQISIDRKQILTYNLFTAFNSRNPYKMSFTELH